MGDNVIKFSTTPLSEIDKQFLKLEEQRKQIEALRNLNKGFRK